MLGPELRIASSDEYARSIDERVLEANIAIDGIYTIMLLLNHGPIQALRGQVLVKSIAPHKDKIGSLVALEFTGADESLRDEPRFHSGFATDFKTDLPYTYRGREHHQDIVQGYLRERLDTDWMDDHLRTMLSQSLQTA